MTAGKDTNIQDHNPKLPFFDLRILCFSFVVIFPIPFIAWVSSVGIKNNLTSKYESAVVASIQKDKGIDIRTRPDVMEKINLNNRCWDPDENEAVRKLCSTRSDIDALGIYAILTLVFSSLLIIGMLVTGYLSRLNRVILLIGFRAGLWVSQISIAALVIANAGLLIAAIYFLESWFVGTVHTGLIGALALTGAFASFKIIKISFTSFHVTEIKVFGKRLGRFDHPELWSFVDTVAKEVGSTSPEHIVLGLDPSFFVTEAPVICLDGTLKGRTLFISLPLCRLFTKKELASVIGHEFAHFVGHDTKFSKWFYPVYRGANETIQTLASHMGEQGNGFHTVAVLPSVFLIHLFLSVFARAENEVSRARELAADAIGALVGGVENMASSLVKVHAYSQAWSFTQDKMKEALISGKQITNASEYFCKAVASVPKEVFKNDLGKTRIVHPTDTHPALSLRLSSLGVHLENCIDKSLIPVDLANCSIHTIQNFEVLECELSDLEHFRIVRSGAVKIPKEKPPSSDAEQSKETA